jgi:hypothetical protein
VFFAHFMPARIRVVTTVNGSTREDHFAPVYRELRPNGPDCPPRCRIAEVEISPPEPGLSDRGPR